jgi:hypothetical protein
MTTSTPSTEVIHALQNLGVAEAQVRREGKRRMVMRMVDCRGARL